MAGSLGTISGQVRLDVKQAVASYAALRAQNQRTVYALRGTSESFLGAGKVMATAGAVGVYAFGKMVMAAAEFERKMDFASAVSGATGEEIQKLSAYALELGKVTIYSAGQIADGFIELAKAGVTAEEMMTGVGEAMTSLGAAADIPLDQAGQIIVSSMSQFNQSVTEASRMVDILAGAANASIADITDLGVSLKYVGGIASQNNQSFEDTSTALALLANAGIRGSTAGTSLRQMLVSLPGVTVPAKNALKTMGIITADGANRFYDLHGNLKPLPQVFQILKDSLKGFNNQQKTTLLRQLFNNRAIGAAVELTDQGAKGFRKMWKEMSKVKAAEVAAERLDNLSGDLEILRGNIETLVIQQGGPFQKTMRKWVQAITELVQAFSDLDPSTQEAIIQGTALASVVLLVMGVIALIIGVIAQFIGSMLKMAAGLKFLGKAAKVLWSAFKLLRWVIAGPLVAGLGALAAALGISVGLLVAIIAVIAGVIAGVVLLYKKWAPFRDLVDAVSSALWEGMKAIGAFFKALVTDPGKAWDMLKAGMSQLGKWIGQLGGLIWEGLKAALGFIGDFVGQAIDWFLSLPGKLLGVIGDFVGKITSIMTFENIGYAIGFLIGTIIRLFISLGIKILSVLLGMGATMGAFFASLPGKIGYLIGFLVGRVVALMLSMGLRVNALVSSMVTSVIAFFQALPGRVIAFVTRMVLRAVALFQKIKRDGPRIISSMVTGIIAFFRALPGRVASALTTMVVKAVALFQRVKNRAITIAGNLATGFVDGIKGLPGLVGGIVGDVIQAFKDVIGKGWQVAKDFAAGLWNGFKKGLGINSPSYIEVAAWQITDVLDEELKTMANQTAKIQSLSRRLATTSFSIGDPNAVRAAESYVDLASMQARNMNRARTLMASSRSASGTAPSSESSSTTARLVEGYLHIDPSGRAYINGVAVDADDRRDSYNDMNSRMGG